MVREGKGQGREGFGKGRVRKRGVSRGRISEKKGRQGRGRE